MEKEERFVTKAENVLRTFKVLSKGDNLESLLEQSFPKIKAKYAQFEMDVNNWFVGRGPEFVLIGIPFGIYQALYIIQQKTVSVKVRANAEKLREIVGRSLITGISPLIVNFFKWDIDRRAWKHANDKYRVDFIRNQVAELDKEIQGKGALLKKYIPMLCDFFIFKIDDFLSQIDDFQKIDGGPDEHEVYTLRETLTKARNSSELREMLGESESEIRKFYVPLARKYITGRLQTTNRFDHLIFGFIEAQNDYKRFLSALVDAIEIVDKHDFAKLKDALQSKDIALFISLLQSIFASVPNELSRKGSEAEFHIGIHILLKGIGCEITSEVSTNLGRIDAVVEFPASTFIIEFKLKSGKEAMEQIGRKQYAQAYVNTGKDVYLLGISFDINTRNVREDFQFKNVAQ